MRYNIRQNWLSTLEVMRTRPIVIMPFVIIAFLETLALEFVYFSTRQPISFAANPIIRKFFGEMFIHYPGNLIVLSDLFYYMQITIYIVIGVLLSSVVVNIFKNNKEGLPIKINALAKNAFSRYFSYLIFGLFVVILIFLLRKANGFIIAKSMRVATRFLPQGVLNLFVIIVSAFLFILNIVMQTFLIFTIPSMVLHKKQLLKAVRNSLYFTFRHFATVFSLVFIPYLIYFPIAILKNLSAPIIEKTFPEMILLVTMLGIGASIFIDCFIILCASQFLLDIEKIGKKGSRA